MKKAIFSLVLPSFLLLITLFTIAVSPAYAQQCNVPGLGQGIRTELGCIPTNPGNLATWFLRLAISIAGGFALLIIILGAFKILTSQGDPKGLQAGKEQITSAVTGLIVIIFATVILRFIGVDILKLPGWG